MKMDLKYESYIDLSPQHIAALRNLINAMMKSVGEHGEFRIELGGSLYYGTYMVTGEMVEVRVTPLKKRLRTWRSHRVRADGHPRQCCWRKNNAKWARKWKVLDESFRQMLEGLSNLGKKLADAFIEMMDSKFKSAPQDQHNLI